MPHPCYTVFINHVGALPESELVTLFRLTDVKDYLHSVRGDLEASETRFKVISPLHQITRKALMSSELIYLQTEQIYLVSVRLEQFDNLPDDEIQSRQTTARAIPPDCMYTTDSQDLSYFAHHFRIELLALGLLPQDITGAFVLTGEGQIDLLYLTASPTPTGWRICGRGTATRRRGCSYPAIRSRGRYSDHLSGQSDTPSAASRRTLDANDMRQQ